MSYYRGGRGRGRGGGFRGGYRNQSFPKPPFDLTLSEGLFPKIKEHDDSFLTQAILKRNDMLSPNSTEQTAVLNLVTKVNSALDKLIVAPDLFNAATIEEIRPVGSFKKGTMMSKRNVADIVVVLKTLPTVEAASALGAKVVELIKASEPRDVVGFVPRDFGGEIAGTGAVIRLLITTIPPNLNKLDPTIHLKSKLVHSHLSAVRHARWFEENASHSSIKVLVRVLKDVRNRFDGLSALTPWALELLAHYCIMNTPNRQPLPLNQAFRRAFQLLSAGIFLPGSAGIMDPCEPNVRVQASMSLEEQDNVCCTAQTLLRVLCHGGYKHVLGIEGASRVASEMTVWDGVVVTPLEKAYEPELCGHQEGAASAEAMEVAG